MQLNAEITKLINQEEGLQQDIEKEKLEFVFITIEQPKLIRNIRV